MLNSIIKGYLSRFLDGYPMYRELEEYKQFEHFINYIVVKRDFLDDFDLDVISVGGGGDCSIDGIATIINNNIINDIDAAQEIIKHNKKISIDFIFIQSKTSDTIDSGEILKFFEGVYDLFKTNNNKNKLDKIMEFIKLNNFLYSNSADFKNNPKIYIKYAYNGIKNSMDDLDKHISSYKDRFKALGLFCDISMEILDANDIQNIYKEITLNVKKTIKLEKIITVPQIESIQESYIGIIPLKEFINLVTDKDRIIKSIFYSNVRDFQGQTSVNKEIVATMKNMEESKYFGLYHNGITIIAKTLRKTGDSITLENFQIVNGCQTSYIIAENKNLLRENEIEKMFIPIKLIATEDNNIINSVVKTTNRHNEVKIEAFESLKKFHKKLEEFYNAKNEILNPKIYYERRSKQYIYDDNIKKYNIITLAEQIKTYLSMFFENPQSSHRYYGELLLTYRDKHSLFKKVNNREHLELYHIAGFAFIKLNAYLIRNKIYSKYKYFKYHILMLFRLQIAHNLSIKSDKKSYKKDCDKFYNILIDDNKCNSYYRHCCNIIDKIIKKNVKINYYNLNRTNSFVESIKNEAKLQFAN